MYACFRGICGGGCWCAGLEQLTAAATIFLVPSHGSWLTIVCPSIEQELAQGGGGGPADASCVAAVTSWSRCLRMLRRLSVPNSDSPHERHSSVHDSFPTQADWSAGTRSLEHLPGRKPLAGHAPEGVPYCPKSIPDMVELGQESIKEVSSGTLPQLLLRPP